MAETVRRVEAGGPLDDAQLLRELAAKQGEGIDRGNWLLARAWGLGQRLGLDGLMRRWRGAAGFALLALVGLVVVGALAAAGAASGPDTRRREAKMAVAIIHGLQDEGR